MYLDKETYERAGLMGKPYGVKGGRGMKPRWSKSPNQILLCSLTFKLVVSYDLRSPAMLHGKKGFDRLIYASKNVLSKPATWLFCNIAESSEFSLYPVGHLSWHCSKPFQHHPRTLS